MGPQDQFRERGYAVFPGVLKGEALRTLSATCDRWIAREDQRLEQLGREIDGLSHRGRRYFAADCQRQDPSLRPVVFGTALADICRVGLGETAYFFFDQFVVKGPETGLPFGWHQDSGYVVGNGGPAEHPPYLTCWCAIDDATVENGTVRVLPFDRVPEARDGVLPHRRLEGRSDLVAWPADEPGDPIEVEAGTVVAFSSRLLHATGANRTQALRRVYLAQYTAEPMRNSDGRLRRNADPFIERGRLCSVS